MSAGIEAAAVRGTAPRGSMGSREGVDGDGSEEAGRSRAGVESGMPRMAPPADGARELPDGGEGGNAGRIGPGLGSEAPVAMTPRARAAREALDGDAGEEAGQGRAGMVEVQRACPADGVPSSVEIARWAEAALAGRSEGAEMTVRVVGEAEGAALNARYRRRAGATNVLAFAFDAPELPSLRILGDVVVCAPVAAREAREQSKRLDAHWAHLVVHGTLHLLGHDHDAPDSAQEMETIERTILGRLGYPDPYAAEVRP